MFDGRWITAFNPAENVYARVEKAGPSIRPRLHGSRPAGDLPLARMFTTDFRRPGQRATSVALVEECSLFDVPTVHLAVRSADVDLQLWIAKGPEPLPRRVVITYKNAPGQPQFRADLYDWNVLAPKIGRRRVHVRSPGGRRADHVPRAATAGRMSPTAPTGEQR